MRQLTDKDRHIITDIKENTVNSIKIKALLEAYGMGVSFVRFFADETGDIVICVFDNSATLYLKDKEKGFEAIEFLQLISTAILAEVPLCPEDYEEEIGGIYSCNEIKHTYLPNVTNIIQESYEILADVFPASINSTNYQRWYAEVSHRVRHGMSKVYNYCHKCSATSYCCVEGILFLAQIGTAVEERGQGMAKSLIHHIATDQPNVKTITLLSQDKASDGFYENIGFKKTGIWYYYTKK